MNISKLLSKSEQQYVQNLIPPNNNARSVCVARLYYGQKGQWKLQSSGIVTLEKQADSGNVAIRFYDWEGGRVVNTTNLYLEMQYHVQTAKFHTFAGESGPVGLAFADSREAEAYYCSLKYELSSPSGGGRINNKPPGQGKTKFTGLARRAIMSNNVNVAFHGFKHVQHVGLDSNGEELKIQARDEEVAAQLLALLGIKVESKEDMNIVYNVIQSHGSNEVRQALDARRDRQDSHNYQSANEVSLIPSQNGPVPPPPPPPPPPPSLAAAPQSAEAGRESLLNSITQFKSTMLKPVEEHF
ncbi:unnamed protein product [Mesocestoides corti]|uniref:WH1 domain-containing protein n=1 Tax=Mesocestoides corti TaxID=53468 RepID=A0A0R3UJ65_MESCO|nr:unnamed protein product [Mesocestoides corti]